MNEKPSPDISTHELEKNIDIVVVDEDGTSPELSHIPEKYRGTTIDQRDMKVLGRRQVFRRNFKSGTMLGFASIVVVSWEAFLATMQLQLTASGVACLFWGSIIVPIGMTFVYMSIAEMASMSPTAGGQYHFVSEHAPPKYQRLLSYITGWLITLGWQTWLTGTSFMATIVIQGLIALNDDTYTWKNWQGTLLVIAVVVAAVIFNYAFAGRLPPTQSFIAVLHVAGVFAIVIPLWIMARPLGNPREVLLHFVDRGNWGNAGLAALVALPQMASGLYGFDSVVHMSEEVHDASKTVPFAMIGGMWINAVLLFLVALPFTFMIGDVGSVLDSPIGEPFIQVILNATNSYVATNFMAVIVAIMLVFACFSEATTASRQIWSFARDEGLPFSKWLSHVTPGSNIPMNAVCVSVGITSLLALINIGSSEALNAINSLASISIVFSYAISIGCLVWRRLWGAPLPPHRWSLGRWGLLVNIVSLGFVTPLMIFTAWPLSRPVTTQNMNWSGAIFIGVIVVAAVYYLVKARHIFVGPTALIKRI